MTTQLNRASESAVLVIDLQRKYTISSSNLVVDDADDLVDRVRLFVEEARTLGARIVWLNRRARPQVGPGRRTTKLFGDRLGAFQNPEVDRQDDRLVPAPGDIVIVKPRHSAFYATDLEVCLRNWGTQGVVLAGVTTNVCVMATAFDAVARDLDVVVASDLTASLPIREGTEVRATSSDVQRNSLAFLQYATGDVLETRSILETWRE